MGKTPYASVISNEVFSLVQMSVHGQPCSCSKKLSLAVLFACFLCFHSTVLEPPCPFPPSSGGEGIQSALDGIPDGGKWSLLTREPMLSISRSSCGTTTRLCAVTAQPRCFISPMAQICPVVVLGLPPVAHLKEPVKDVRLADLLIDGNRTNQQKEVWQFLSDGGGLYNNGVDVWGHRSCDGGARHLPPLSFGRHGDSSARVRRLTVRDFEAFDNQFDGLACYPHRRQ